MFDDLPTNIESAPEYETEVAETDLLKAAQKYAVLVDRKKNIEDEVKKIAAEIAEIPDAIAERMMLDNPRIRVKVGSTNDGTPVFRTVYARPEIWAGHNGDEAALVEAMKESGLESMVKEKFNVQTLSGYVRGLDPDKNMTTEELLDEVPPKMRPHIKISKLLKLGCRS
jgi:hypothetical protein